MDVWIVTYENEDTGRTELYGIYDNREAALEYARWSLCVTFQCDADSIAEEEWSDGSAELRTVELAPFCYMVKRFTVRSEWKAELGEIPF